MLSNLNVLSYVILKARGTNQARNGIIFGPQDNIQLVLDLALNTTKTWCCFYLLSEEMKMT